MLQIRKHKLQIQVVPDPYRGEEIERLLKHGKILLPPSEIKPCIEHFHRLTQNDGSVKLGDRLKLHYFGLSRKTVTKVLSESETHFALNPKFVNKAPLRPVEVKQPMGRHQIDLVDMSSIAHLVSGKPRKRIYVLSILDCYTRFLWVRLITEKSSEVVARTLEDLYLETGTPQIIQTDRGTEFRGAVRILCSRLGIILIYSSPHHPQTNGKVERSHATWKKKIRAFVHDAEEQSKDWTKKLPFVIKMYNDAYHSSIKMSPYKLLYGIESNFKLTSYKDGMMKESDISEMHMESVDDEDAVLCGDRPSDVNVSVLPLKKRRITVSEVREAAREINTSLAFDNRLSDFTELRRKASQHSSNSAMKMVRNFSSKHPPNTYADGELVLVKCEGRDKGVRRGGLSLNKPRVYKGVVCEKKNDYTYTIVLLSKERRGETLDVNVEKITSLTKQQEKDRSSSKSETVYSVGKTKSALEITLDQLQVLLSASATGDTGLEQLQKNAAAGGMVLDSNNSGNGNCMFLAIQQQLAKLGIRKTVMEIRKEVAEYLRKNPVIGKGKDKIKLPTLVDDWNAYLNGLAQDGVWGDMYALIGASNLYNVGIWVVSSLPEAVWPTMITPQNGITVGDLYLGHISEVHYVTLRPAEQESEVSANEDLTAIFDSSEASQISSLNVTLCDACGHIGEHDCMAAESLIALTPNAQLTDTTEGYQSSWCQCHLHLEHTVSGDVPCEICGRMQARRIEHLTDNILFLIFALASLYCDETIRNISLVCKRWHGLINSPTFRRILYTEWHKRAINWSNFSNSFRNEYSADSTGLKRKKCKMCGKEYKSTKGLQRGPDGLIQFYSDGSEFCSHYCEYSSKGSLS